MNFKILTDKYFKDYENSLDFNLSDNLPTGETPIFTNDAFSFYTSISSVFSSKIEGEDIEIDSYMKHRFMKVKFKPDYTKKTDDLYKAYEFAKNNTLTRENLLKSHTILTKNLLSASQRGKVRQGLIYVQDQNQRIIYIGTDPRNVAYEFENLLEDIQLLLNMNLSFNETFYYAALIHLIFVKIHPFADGNGRSARLLEKWFLAEKLGERAWYITSEKFYYQYIQNYYHNLQILGMEYETLNYDKCLPFLLMLPKSLFN
jgi:Fic family protein